MAQPHAAGGGRQVLTAVDGVSLDIVRGQIFALVGDSGSGKSTLARMVVGLLPPTSSAVTIDGVSMTDLAAAPARRRIQMIFLKPLRQPQPALPRGAHRRRADLRLRLDPG